MRGEQLQISLNSTSGRKRVMFTAMKEMLFDVQKLHMAKHFLTVQWNSHYVWAHYLAKNIAVFASFKAFYIGTYRCNLRHTLFLRLPLLLGRRSHHISNLTIICYEIVVNAPATRLMTGITVVVALKRRAKSEFELSENSDESSTPRVFLSSIANEVNCKLQSTQRNILMRGRNSLISRNPHKPICGKPQYGHLN